MNVKLIVGGGLIVAGTFALGYGTGYYFTRKSMIADFQRAVDSEVAAYRDHSDRINKEGRYSDPSNLVTKPSQGRYSDSSDLVTKSDSYEDSYHVVVDEVPIFQQKISELGYSGIEALQQGDKDLAESQGSISNAFETYGDYDADGFDDDDDDDGFEEESPLDIDNLEPRLVLPLASEVAAFAISETQYQVTKLNWDKMSVTYFQEDDTLCDAEETIIPDLDGTINYQNLQYFGVESGNDKVMFVRNPIREVDFEVELVEGAYSKIVLGIDDWDSNTTKSPKFVQRKMRDDE
jgi:hypothetical protein